MKKFILSAVAILLVGGACCVNAQEKSKEELKAEKALLKAQQKELNGFLKEAKKKGQFGEGYTPDFAAARVAIENASKSPLAANSVEFYMAAADVESNAFTSAVVAQDYPALGKAAAAGFNYYKKAYELAAGDKGKMTKIQEGALNIYKITNGMSLVGNVFYQEAMGTDDEAAKREAYRNCLDSWQMAKTAHLEPMIKDNANAKEAVALNASDSAIIDLTRNCYQVAMVALDDTLAANKELLYLKDNAKDETLVNQAIQSLAINAYSTNDSVRFEGYLKEGLNRFPNEKWYMENLLRAVYFPYNRFEEAENLLGDMMKAEPENPTLYYFKGYALEQMGKEDEALPFYEQAYKMDPSDEGVVSSLGRYYYNKAENILNEYYDKKQFEAGDKAAQAYFDKAFPYYEAAYELDTDRKDKGVGIALRRLLALKISTKGQKQLQPKYNEVSLEYGLGGN